MNGITDYMLGVVAGICSGICIGYLVFVSFDQPYKKGQIDAINGNIKYEIVVMPDSTTQWVKIKE